MIHRLLAFSLRGTTLVIRFGLSVLVARSLDMEQAGLFFLYIAGVQIASSLLPMDLYANTARALIRSKPGQRHQKRAEIERHFGAIMLLAVVFGPVGAAIFFLSSPSVDPVLALLFTAHVGLEAFSNDVGRLLVPLSRPLLAAAYLFFRSATWIVPAGLLLETGLWTTDAVGLVVFWFISSAIMAIGGAMLTGRAAGFRFGMMIDREWLQTALRQSLLFLAGSLAFRFVAGGDRFLVERALGLEAVAVYGFYVSLAFGLLALVETGNSAWSYPRLVRAIQNRDRGQIRGIFLTYLGQNTLGSVVLTALLAFGFPLIAVRILDPVYVEHTDAFQLVCMGVFFLCFSLPFQYTIYGFGSDALRLLGMIIGMIAMIIAWVALLPDAGLFGAGLMLAISLGAIAFSRVIGGFALMATIRHWPH